MDKLRFFVADDHLLMLKTITEFIIKRGYEVTGTATDGKETLESILKFSPDIAFIDNQMPYLSGIEVARECTEAGSNTKIVLLSFEAKINTAEKLKSHNLAGYLLKDSIINEFEPCVKTVLNGDHYLSEKIRDQQKDEIHQLTPSEKKILKLVAQENTLDGLHEKLFISESQWDELIGQITRKLHLKSSDLLHSWVKTNQDLL